MKKFLLLLWVISYCIPGSGQRSDKEKQKMADLINQAVVAKNSGDFEKAIVIIDSVLTIDSTHYGSYVIKSGIFRLMGMYAEAAANLKKATLLGKPRVESYVMLGMLYDKAKMALAAKPEYLSAIELYEHDKNQLQAELSRKIYYVVALALYGNQKKSEKVLETLIKSYPSEVELKNLKGKSKEEVLEIYFKKYSS